MRLLRARQTTAQVTACINSLCPRYLSICYCPEAWISFKTRKKKLSVFYERRAIWYFLQKCSSLVQIFKPIRPGAWRPVMALTCPCAMTSSDSTQSQGTERWNSPRRFHSAHDVSCDYPDTYWYSRAGTADDTRRQPTNETGSGVCNWSRSVRHMPLVS